MTETVADVVNFPTAILSVCAVGYAILSGDATTGACLILTFGLPLGILEVFIQKYGDTILLPWAPIRFGVALFSFLNMLANGLRICVF